MKDHNPRTERMRATKPKRSAFKTEKRLGACRLPRIICAGYVMAESIGALRKGDKFCPDCSEALTGMYRRNEGTPVLRGNWR